ncbi:MAG: transporter substrate-binding domain-containing protein [Salibacter sp.]|uniref:substrate-binding periplasmic protein n=1 Tax=Salibacter sp. TaxID=2010995 RepID=UPI00287060F7|nr:transporter substrate-binding domain-containing protein [Salibacter sp.]MDR9398845.1 transporter substrate-binding domain-containing protein [Salibacter sp.]
MKRVIVFAAFIIAAFSGFTQTSWSNVQENGEGTLKVFIQEEFPFAYFENGELVGIEVDILKSFEKWVENREDVDLHVEFVRYNQFIKLYEDVKASKNVVGAAFTTINKERALEVDFTPTYLKNSSVLISRIDVPTLRSFSDFENVFGDKTALVIRGTTHEKELMEVKRLHNKEMIVKYVNQPDEMLPLLNLTNDYYAMVDLLTFWNFVKQNNGNLKLHRIATVDKEEYGFMLPKNSDWSEPFNKFFTEGFGFTASEEYRSILNKYLGKEVIDAVVKE